MIPHRESYWNIGGERLAVYLVAIVVIALLAYGVWRHLRLWRMGQPENRSDHMSTRIISVLGRVLGHGPLLRDPYPGVMHLLIFWGFIVLFIGTAMDNLEYWGHTLLGVSYLQGNLYLAFSIFTDLFGLLALVGILMAVFRRYGQRPDRLDNIMDDGILLLLLFLSVFSGFVIEGFRIAATELVDGAWWLGWSPVGYLFALVTDGLGLRGEGLLLAHRVGWFSHLSISMGTLGYFGWSKLGHILFSPLNIFFRDYEPRGALQPIPNFEEAETFGVARPSEFTWKQLLDLDACTRCGRCQDNCPAYLSGKPLSPKRLIQDIKSSLYEQAALKGAATADGGGGRDLISEVVTEPVIWSCTTCAACVEVCPCSIEHIDKIVDMRRYLVLMESRFPDTAMQTLRNVEQRGHPWRGTIYTRTDWAQDLGVKSLSEDPNVEWLFWVGCTGALSDRNIKVTQALAHILQRAGVSFGILGMEETCCGEPARRLGNEYLYQMLAEANIETMKGYGVKKIVTACPHCFNTIKNEYPQLGGQFEVVHHSQFIAELIRSGKIRLQGAIHQYIAYHDSCYLGRHNNIYADPRQIVSALPQAQLVEMERRGPRSFCCGAGGGLLWVEDSTGKRINHVRTEQLLATRAEVVGVACPFCLQMFEDGLKAKEAEERVSAKDIAELVAQALG